MHSRSRSISFVGRCIRIGGSVTKEWTLLHVVRERNYICMYLCAHVCIFQILSFSNSSVCERMTSVWIYFKKGSLCLCYVWTQEVLRIVDDEDRSLRKDYCFRILSARGTKSTQYLKQERTSSCCECCGSCYFVLSW